MRETVTAAAPAAPVALFADDGGHLVRQVLHGLVVS